MLTQTNRKMSIILFMYYVWHLAVKEITQSCAHKYFLRLLRMNRIALFMTGKFLITIGTSAFILVSCASLRRLRLLCRQSFVQLHTRLESHFR